MDWKYLTIAKITLTVVMTVALSYAAYKSSALILSALIGVGFSVIAHPLIDKISEKTKVSHLTSALILLFSILFIALILVFGSSALLLEQADSLQEKFPEIVKSWQKYFELLADRYPVISRVTDKAMPSGLAESILKGAAGLFNSTMAAITGFTLAIIIGFFTTINYPQYKNGLQKIVPNEQQNKWNDQLQISAQALRNWFFAQFLDMCVVGVLTAIGLWIAGINYWAIYGLLAGLLSIMPYVGIVLTLIISGSVVLILQPEKMMWLLIVFAVTQNLEGNLILPQLMKENAQVPAAPLVFFMILAGVWFGFLGIFVTPPLMAISVALMKYHKKKA